MRNIRPLTLDTLFEASEEAMEVGRKIKKRADRIRAQNADVRSGKPTKDRGHAQHVAKSDAQNPPGSKKGRLTKDQRNALSNRARRQLKSALAEALEDDGPDMNADKRAKTLATNRAKLKKYKATGDKDNEDAMRSGFNQIRRKTKKGSVFMPKSKRMSKSDANWGSWLAKKQLKSGMNKKLVGAIAKKDADDARYQVRTGQRPGQDRR